MERECLTFRVEALHYFDTNMMMQQSLLRVSMVNSRIACTFAFKESTPGCGTCLLRDCNNIWQ